MENLQNPEPNGGNNATNGDSGNINPSNGLETPQVPNVEVENNGANNDSNNVTNQDDDVSISKSQGHENVSTEVFEENDAQVVITSETKETGLGIEETMIEETAPAPSIEEITPEIGEATPISETRMVVHKYSTAGIAFVPPFALQTSSSSTTWIGEISGSATGDVSLAFPLSVRVLRSLYIKIGETKTKKNITPTPEDSEEDDSEEDDSEKEEEKEEKDEDEYKKKSELLKSSTSTKPHGKLKKTDVEDNIKVKSGNFVAKGDEMRKEKGKSND
ncbi:endonuclease 4 homolog [Papaver somniferum]|uniref:endonuclease 4 homolog n=1 Tax=Papaver somniferum TaxID=3469 RepID=UPI000E6FE716|nr:endonuclease 4 homolog [Papaver somniferum]